MHDRPKLLFRKKTNSNAAKFQADRKMKQIRRQVTLFLDDHYSTQIETIRREYDPVQFGVIRSHVTL